MSDEQPIEAYVPLWHRMEAGGPLVEAGLVRLLLHYDGSVTWGGLDRDSPEEE